MLLRRFVLGLIFTTLLAALSVPPAGAAAGPIAIDAGHGGSDTGAVGPTGFTEKEANLDIARRVRDLLQQNGYQVAMTRDSDVYKGLQERCDIANRAGARIFVSIHNNAFTADSRGTETYYYSGAGAESGSVKLAGAIQREVVAEVGLFNRGVKSNNYYVLHHTNMPAALLEGAFISNPAEEALLKTPEFRQKLASGIYRGIKACAGPSGPEPTTLGRSVPAGRQIEIDLNEYFYEKSVSALVTADVHITAERTMYFNNSSGSGSTVTRGSIEPKRTWYLAEGCTYPGFQTWLLFANPTPYKAKVRIKYMTDEGSRPSQPITLLPFSRRSVHVNPFLPNRSFGVRVVAERPIVVERSVYFKYGTKNGGHTALGVISPSKTWSFADGNTKADTDTWICLLNPDTVPARVALTYVTPTGKVKSPTFEIPPYRRRTISVDGAVGDAEVSVRVASDRRIVAEKVVYFNYNGIKGGSVTVGTRPNVRWLFAEGDTRSGRMEQLTLFNPSNRDANVAVDYLMAKGFARNRKRRVPAGSRLVLRVNDQAEAGPNRRMAVRLTSDTGIVAERSMYRNVSGYSGGDSSTGMTGPSKTWYFAEGFTGGGFNTRLIISNPSKYRAKVKVRFMK